jgi:phosphatidylglycerol:prolipoprotein diacylglycerol transferase
MLAFLGPAEFWRLLPTIPSHGSTLFGGLIGGYIAVTVTEHLTHVDRCTGDLIAPFLPLGQAIGRLGNFLAGDAYGLPTSSPWAVYQAGAYRHPVQLYELVLDLALFAFLFRRRYVSFRDGELFQMYIVGYSLIRFPLEFLRYQPTPVPFLGLTLVQWVCIAAVLGFGYQLYRRRKGANLTGNRLPHFGEKAP